MPALLAVFSISDVRGLRARTKRTMFEAVRGLRALQPEPLGCQGSRKRRQYFGSTQEMLEEPEARISRARDRCKGVFSVCVHGFCRRGVSVSQMTIRPLERNSFGFWWRRSFPTRPKSRTNAPITPHLRRRRMRRQSNKPRNAYGLLLRDCRRYR